eukprot:SAG22_NODE_7878_length_700_cov_5.086522_2_plen_37_part_01
MGTAAVSAAEPFAACTAGGDGGDGGGGDGNGGGDERP